MNHLLFDFSRSLVPMLSECHNFDANFANELETIEVAAAVLRGRW